MSNANVEYCRRTEKGLAAGLDVFEARHACG